MNSLPAGKYYVGDLCYVMQDEWSEVCDIMFSNSSKFRGSEGVLTLKSGVKFAIYGTAHGDGEYSDQFGNKYPVDSGTIGCILVSDINNHPDNNIELGNVHDIPEPFEVYYNRGVINIGNISIDTDPVYEDDDFEED